MKTFFRKRQKSFRYAFSGIAFVLKTQKNAWIHLFFTVLVITVGLLLKLSNIQWTALILCFGLVWLAEFINTAVEVVVDLVSPEFHPLARKCKDVAAGAVLIAAICSIIIGLLILAPALYQAIFIH
ncbi:MAG: diacylglycerol kinase family protein [Chloroflexi bacterium]|nr:diacylglycerol kinase family protein [Chloroflexota bacterium]